MPYEILWIIEGRVILGRFSGVLEADTLVQFSDEIGVQIAAHYQPGGPLIHFINDSRHTSGMQFSMKMLQSAVRTMKHADGVGWNIHIVNSHLNQMFAALGDQFAGNRSRQFFTPEDACAFLNEIDDSLPEITPAMLEGGSR